MNRVSTRAEFQPGLKYDLGHAHRLSCECKTLSCNLFPPNFKHCLRAEIRHVIATKFQPGGRSEISARAEFRHVIGPLKNNYLYFARKICTSICF